MITDRNRINMIRTVRIFDDAGVAIPGIAWNDPALQISYKKNAGDWVDLTLQNATLKVYLDSGWVSDARGNGLYELGIPNAAASPGQRVIWGYKYSTNGWRYDSIDYLAIPSVTSDAIEFSFAIPGSDVVFASSGQAIYIKETGLQAVFTANQDIESESLVLIMETDDQVDQYVFYDAQMTKVGTDVTVTLPQSFTDEVTTLNWAIREASTKRYYGGGSLNVTYAPHEDV